jgi:hypothetical protein
MGQRAVELASAPAGALAVLGRQHARGGASLQGQLVSGADALPAFTAADVSRVLTGKAAGYSSRWPWRVSRL